MRKYYRYTIEYCGMKYMLVDRKTWQSIFESSSYVTVCEYARKKQYKVEI